MRFTPEQRQFSDAIRDFCAREYGMEQQVRAALAPPIYGGTNEIQREIVSRVLGL